MSMEEQSRSREISRDEHGIAEGSIEHCLSYVTRLSDAYVINFNDTVSNFLFY